eukprot:scaffold699_cov385-Prasinococcus_capsulatus_cf.AAC.36
MHHVERESVPRRRAASPATTHVCRRRATCGWARGDGAWHEYLAAGRGRAAPHTPGGATPARQAGTGGARGVAMSRELMFENDFAVCWRTTIAPDNPLKMHRHERCRVVVALQGGTLTKTEDTGETSELVFETGTAVGVRAWSASSSTVDL